MGGAAYPGAPFFYSPQQMQGGMQQRGGPGGFMYPQQMMMRGPAPGYQQMGQYGGAMAMGNRAGGRQGMQGGRGPQGGPAAPPTEINAATLAAAPHEQQKQLLGERLF